MGPGRRILLLAVVVVLSCRAQACEPVLPFIQAAAPMLALAGSIYVLGGAVLLKSVLFTFFERGLPRLRAAWLMFLGNILTSFVGLFVAALIGSGPIVLVGIPVVFLLCWPPCRRLVKAAPLPWLGRTHAWGLAALMTMALLASCILFMAGQGAIYSHRLALYWVIKVGAIFLALLPSVTLTVVWEEWIIWRLGSRAENTEFFAPVLRTNLYVLVLVVAVPAAMILPQRLKSPDFLVKRPQTVAVTVAAPQPPK